MKIFAAFAGEILLRRISLVVCSALLLAAAPRTSAQVLKGSLPVYSVAKAGALPSEAANLATRLGIPAGSFVLTNGEIGYVDPAGFMAPPVLPVNDPAVQSNLLADTVNKVPGMPIHFEQPDFAALNALTVLGSNAAVLKFSQALDGASLLPQSAAPVVTHTMLSAVYTNGPGSVLTASNYLDTQVSYQFSLQGLPLVGPGAQVQVAFGPTGAVTRLQYATRQLVLGQDVVLITPSDATNRAAALFGVPPAQVTAQLVYYAPPLSMTTVSNIIPWYLCGGTATIPNPVGGQPTVKLKPALIPATDDANYVPAVQLSAVTGSGGTQVMALASVMGGSPPYQFLWSASGADVSSNNTAQVTYSPTILVAPARLSLTQSAAGGHMLSWVDPSGRYTLESATGFDPAGWTAVTDGIVQENGVSSLMFNTGSQPHFYRLRLATQQVNATETVGVGVVDHNGVVSKASQSMAVGAMPYSPPVQYNGPLIGWATESPYSCALDGWDTASWRSSMGSNPVFGAERYFRGEFVADRTDFLDAPAGNNDLLVDSADIVYYLGHGNADQITFTSNFSQPGTPTSWLTDSEVFHAWGNRQQEWLALLSCDVLDQFSPYNSKLAFDRWGQAFDGLHLMLGFSTEAWSYSLTGVGGDSFDTVFVNGMAGKNPWAVTIQQAWFHAALTTGPLFIGGGIGNPAVLAPIAAGGVWDLNDHWWGVGTVGPRIRSWNIAGWYYLTVVQQ